MNGLVLGVIGHVDHGKTAIVRALTGIDTDRLPEEKLRGISIALGFAYFSVGDMDIEIVDMPGHERFVRTMVSGATGIDIVLLVVAANEGIKPQTREHLDIAALLGIRRAVVAISKADLVGPEVIQAVTREVRLLLSAMEIAAPEPIPTSCRTGEGIEALRATLAEQLATPVIRQDRGFAWLPIDRAFSIAGYGTIVTGTLRYGGIAVGQELELVPSGRLVRVRGLQVHRRSENLARPGQRVAVNLRGVQATTITTGQALSTKGLLPASRWLSVELRLASGASLDLQTGDRRSLLFGTVQTEARIRLLDRDKLTQGEACAAQVCCTVPVSVPARECFILRAISPPKTVAGGCILDPQATRLRRNAVVVQERLRHLAHAKPEESLSREVDACGSEGRSVSALARLVGMSPTKTVATLQKLPVVIGRSGIVVARSALDFVVQSIRRVLDEHSSASEQGLGRDQLRTKLNNVSSGVMEIALAQLIATDEIRQDSGRVYLAHSEQEHSRASEESEASVRVAMMLLEAGLMPPESKLIFAENPKARRAVDRLVRSGVVIRVIERVQKREILFHREAIRHAQKLLEPKLATAQGLLVSDIGVLLGISRKYCIPLLEYLDSVRYTRRIGDRRVLYAEPRS